MKAEEHGSWHARISGDAEQGFTYIVWHELEVKEPHWIAEKGGFATQQEAKEAAAKLLSSKRRNSQ